MTDEKGKFKIIVSTSNATLVISSIGYDAKEIKLNGQSTISAALTSSDQSLNEVVVTASGIKRSRREIAYSTTIISTDQLYGSQAPSVSNGYVNGLLGKVAGVQVTNSNKSYLNGNGRNGIADTTDREFNTEDYDAIIENRFLKVDDNPLSTFSIDVDAASYSNIRRFIQAGQLPPAGAVRIEEMINYFKYDYEAPKTNILLKCITEMSDCPWNKDHRLVLVGLQGKKIPTETLPASNIVFLIDVSGSMDMENKLPLVKSSMKLLVDQLREQDKVSMVVYAGNAGMVLPPTSGAEKIKIKDAIDRLEAGGSTAGGEGIKLAYKIAKENFIKSGNNRVILCTDGDFNVGVSSDDDTGKNDRTGEEKRRVSYCAWVMGWEIIRIIKCRSWQIKEMVIMHTLMESMKQKKYW